MQRIKEENLHLALLRFIFDFIVLPLVKIMRNQPSLSFWFRVELKWLVENNNTKIPIDSEIIYISLTIEFDLRYLMAAEASVGISFVCKKKKTIECLPFILRLTEQLDGIDAIWVFTHFSSIH